MCFTGKSCPSVLTSLQMLLCRSGSTFFFPVAVLLIPRDFPHVVLTSLFVCARYLWHRWIHFIERGGGSFQRGWHPLVLNLDEDCYYYRFHLFSIKNEKHLTKHSFVSACTERFFDTVFGIFPACYGSMVHLSDYELSVTCRVLPSNP